MKISVVVPVYNEEGVIKSAVDLIFKELKKNKMVEKFEVIAVDDGSTDTSLKRMMEIKHKNFTCLRHKTNKGYGAALKTGISSAIHDWILIIDADGTYPVKQMKNLIEKCKKSNCDMVIGARIKKKVKIEKIRILPKKIVLWFANFLTGEKILDINSGMRIFRRSLAHKFWHLFPNKFSFTTTITISSLLSGYEVEFVPIDYYKRVGKSSIKPSDFFYFLGVIVRLVVYFKPLKFFFFPGLMSFVFAFLYMVYTAIVFNNITDTGLLLLFLGMQFMFFGLIADLIVKNRNSNNGKNIVN